jgi:hypothetical protein
MTRISMRWSSRLAAGTGRPRSDPPPSCRKAKFPLAEPLGQLVGVTGPQRLQEHERLLLPRAIVADCGFPTCIVPTLRYPGFDGGLMRI